MKIGIFSLSSCSGCQIELLNLESKILDLLSILDIKEAQILMTGTHDGDFDLVFIEGSPTTEHEVELLKSLRERSGLLVALGSCACLGGVQTMIADVGMEKAVERQYGKAPVESIMPAPISDYVKVDAMLYGCPFERKELLELVRSLVMDTEFRYAEHSVCTECVLRENECLLDLGEPCMGPVTRGGCNARCPSSGMYCTGCRGGYSDMNTDSHIRLLRDAEYDDEAIRAMYNKYGRRME